MPATVYVIKPITSQAKSWLSKHVQCEDWQRIDEGVAVEWRFVEGLLRGMADDGLFPEIDFEVTA